MSPEVEKDLKIQKRGQSKSCSNDREDALIWGCYPMSKRQSGEKTWIIVRWAVVFLLA